MENSSVNNNAAVSLLEVTTIIKSTVQDVTRLDS